MYSQNASIVGAAQLSDLQLLDNNYNIIDNDNNEIVLTNGQKVDVYDNLSEDEIHNDYVDTDPNMLIADLTGWNCSSISYTYESGYYVVGHVYANCFAPIYQYQATGYIFELIVYIKYSTYTNAFVDAGNGKGYMFVYCSGYKIIYGFSNSYVYNGTTYFDNSFSHDDRCK